MQTKQRKVICRNCEHVCKECDLLTAPNPFVQNDTIQACPNCKEISDVDFCCEHDNCNELSTCGTPTESGYVFTCGKHRPTNQQRTEIQTTLELWSRYTALTEAVAKLKTHRDICAAALAKIAHQQSITGRQAQHLATTALNRISAVKPAKSAGT